MWTAAVDLQMQMHTCTAHGAQHITIKTVHTCSYISTCSETRFQTQTKTKAQIALAM